jgi:predicted anti-sigma-YlaC factor YlaD
MLSCKETSLLVSQARDRRLSWAERIRVRLHLWMCSQCRRFERQLNWLNGLTGRLERAPEELMEEQQELSAEARERIRQAIEAHGEGCAHRHPH